MLYTAVSRAKEKCIIIADDGTFKKAFEKKCVRISKLNEMICEQFDSKYNNNSDIKTIINL